MSCSCTPVLTPFSSAHSAQVHGSTLEYFRFASQCEPKLSPENLDIALCLELSSCTPTDSLPNEILSSIFEAGYFEGEDLNSDFRVLIGKISRRWREAAHGTPSLWSIYHLSQGNLDKLIDVLPAFIQRSGNYPLDIHLNCFWDPSQTKEVMGLFLPHSQRWKTLSITTPGADVFRYLYSIPAPRLETLQITHFSSQRYLPLDRDLFSGHLPSLRSLRLQNMSFRGTTLPLRFLHSLDVRGYGVWPEQDELDEMIGGSTNLRNLTLHIRPESVLEDVKPQNETRIVLPALRSFDVITSEGVSPRLAALSRLFSCPYLDTFVVKDGSPSTTIPPHGLVRCSRTGSATYPDAPLLSIKTCNLYYAWGSLSSSRNITTLELDDARWPHWSQCMTVFASLPLLQNLIIANVDTTDALADLGMPPYPLKVAKLKNLEVGFTRHKWDVEESDFATFVGVFDVPELRTLAIRDISWQQWKHLTLVFMEKVKKYPSLVSLMVTNLHGLTHSLLDPSLAFPHLQNLTLIRTAANPMLQPLAVATPRLRTRVTWPKLRNLVICGDPDASSSFLRQIVASRSEYPLSLILDTHFQSDLESWKWLEENTDVILMPTVKL